MSSIEKAICGCSVLFAIIVTILLMQPPAPVATSAASGEFSALRAKAHLKHISKDPHPVGSAEHAAVRDYIVHEMQLLGYEVRVQHKEAVNQIFGWNRGATVDNIIARYPAGDHRGNDQGSVPKNAIAIVAHYDTVPHSFGACDDGAAVAAMIETARALRGTDRTQNNIVFLFTDAEEVALVGANAALDAPEMKRVRVVLNFEARGCSGLVAMYQHSTANSLPGRSLIEYLASAAPRPIASSLVGLLSKRLPNTTDVDVFSIHGLSFLNFAFADGLKKYHSSADNIRSLDLRSLQHQGSYMMSLARELGSSNLDSGSHDGKNERPAQVYADIAGRYLVHYSKVSAWLILLVLIVVSAVFLKRRRARYLTVLLSSTVGLLSVLLSGAIILGLNMLIGSSKNRIIANYMALSLSYIMFTMVIVHVCMAWLYRRYRALDVYAGIFLLWLFLAIVTTWSAVEASYLFSWTAAAGLLILLSYPHSDDNQSTGRISSLALSWAGYVIAASIASEFIYILLIMASGTMPLILAIVVALFASLFSLLFFYNSVEGFTGIKRFASISSGFRVFVLLSAIVLYLVVLFAEPTIASPGVDTTNYVVDVDQKKTFWEKQTDQKQYGNDVRSIKKAHEGQPVHGLLNTPVLLASAPIDDTLRTDDGKWLHPTISLKSVQNDPHDRKRSHYSFQLRSQRSAPCIYLWQESGPEILSSKFNDRVPLAVTRFSPEKDRTIFIHRFNERPEVLWKTLLCGYGDHAIDLELLVAERSEQLRFRVSDHSYRLPQFADDILGELPNNYLTSRQGNRTIITKAYEF